jgi:enterochelin esterase-like enzyme
MSLDTAGGWSRVVLDCGPVDLFSPEGDEPAGLAVLFLHGSDRKTLEQHERLARELAVRRIPAVCPHCEDALWLDVVSRGPQAGRTVLADLRAALVPFLRERWGIAPPRIGLLGVEWGGQGVLQLAYRFPREFPVVAAVSPAVDFHILHGSCPPLDALFADPEAARQQTVTLQLHPLNWPRDQYLACDPRDGLFFDGVERLASKLWSMGIPFEADLQPAPEAAPSDPLAARGLTALAFVLERLSRPAL